MNESQQHKQAVAGVFGRAAPTYDTFGPRFFAALGRRLVELADIPPGTRVLDVATGRGAVLFPLVERVGAHGYVHGVDLAEPMVQAVNEEIARRGIANADVRVMDAEQLQFDDESFDVVTCGFAIFFLPDAQKGLREFFRVLKKGGQVVLSTWGEDDARWSWVDELVKTYLPPKLDVQDTKVTRGFQKPDDMQQHLTQAGFHAVRVVTTESEFIYADADEWWNAQWSHGGRWTLEKLSPESLADFQREVRAQFAARQQPDGLPIRMRVLYTQGTK